MTDNEKKKSVPAILFTVAITIGMVWAALEILNDPTKKTEPNNTETEAVIKSNEQAAIANLKHIYTAQEKYKTLNIPNLNKDNKKKYAAFFVHLWTSVTLDGQQVQVNLIPKQTAFAMDATNSINGYYFKDLRNHKDNTDQNREFDYTQEWAVAAIPAQWGKTGTHSFKINQTGQIHRSTSRTGTGPYMPETKTKGVN